MSNQKQFEITSWEQWFTEKLLPKIETGGVKLTQEQKRTLKHAFVAGWDARGQTDGMLLHNAFQQIELFNNAAIYMQNEVKKYWQAIDQEHREIDEALEDLLSEE